MENPKRYLGDGVYCEFDGYYFWLWTSNGIEDSTKIALEPEVIGALLKFRTDEYAKHGATP